MATIRAERGKMRVYRDERHPEISLDLADGEYIVRLDIDGDRYAHPDRVTWDMRWTAWVVSP